MLRIFNGILFLLAFCSAAFAQQTAEGCDGMRYLQPVFTDLQKTTVTYGSNKNQANALVTLQMDVYEPVGDNATKRPAIVLAHGGSFILGNKTDLAENCEFFARSGYVAVSITYRLYPFLSLGFPDSAKIMTTAVMAMGDMKAAIRYLREDAATTNTFKIDPDYIFSGGYSAGAIVGVGAGMMDSTDTMPQFVRDIVTAQGGFEGNSGSASNQTYSSEVIGVFNRSGGIYQKEWIDANDPIMCSIHGTVDDVVFFDRGLANGYLFLDGSGQMHPYMGQLGVRNYLKAVQGGGHTDVYFNASYRPQYDEFLNTSLEVFNELLCGVSGTETPISNQEAAWNVQPNPNNGAFLINFPLEKGAYQVQIINLQGRVVFEKNNLQGAANIEADLGAGMYLLRLTEAENNRVSVGKMLVSGK